MSNEGKYSVCLTAYFYLPKFSGPELPYLQEEGFSYNSTTQCYLLDYNESDQFAKPPLIGVLEEASKIDVDDYRKRGQFFLEKRMVALRGKLVALSYIFRPLTIWSAEEESDPEWKNDPSCAFRDVVHQIAAFTRECNCNKLSLLRTTALEDLHVLLYGSDSITRIGAQALPEDAQAHVEALVNTLNDRDMVKVSIFDNAQIRFEALAVEQFNLHHKNQNYFNDIMFQVIADISPAYDYLRKDVKNLRDEERMYLGSPRIIPALSQIPEYLDKIARSASVKNSGISNPKTEVLEFNQSQSGLALYRGFLKDGDFSAFTRVTLKKAALIIGMDDLETAAEPLLTEFNPSEKKRRQLEKIAMETKGIIRKCENLKREAVDLLIEMDRDSRQSRKTERLPGEYLASTATAQVVDNAHREAELYHSIAKDKLDAIQNEIQDNMTRLINYISIFTIITVAQGLIDFLFTIREAYIGEVAGQNTMKYGFSLAAYALGCIVLFVILWRYRASDHSKSWAIILILIAIVLIVALMIVTDLHPWQIHWTQ